MRRTGRQGWRTAHWRGLLLGLLCLQSLCAIAQADLVWEDHFSDEQSIVNGASITTPGGTGVTFGRTVYSDFTGGTFDLDPHINGDYLTFEQGKMGGETGYLEFSLDNENNDPNDFVELALNFDRAVTDLQFSLLDIDSSQAWDDGVEVFYNGTNNVRDNSGINVVTGTYNGIDDESYMHGWEGLGKNAGNGILDANIAFDFGSIAITSLTIRFFSTDDARSDPNGQRAGLSDLTFNEAVPEGSSLAYMGLFGLVVLSALLQRFRSRQWTCREKRPQCVRRDFRDNTAAAHVNDHPTRVVPVHIRPQSTLRSFASTRTEAA